MFTQPPNHNHFLWTYDELRDKLINSINRIFDKYIYKEHNKTKLALEEEPPHVKVYYASNQQVSMCNEDESNYSAMYGVNSSMCYKHNVWKVVDPKVQTQLDISDGSEFDFDVENWKKTLLSKLINVKNMEIGMENSHLVLTMIGNVFSIIIPTI
jgi:hypothetical protein